MIAEYVKSRPEIKRVATIAPDYEYGQQFTEDFVRALKAARPDVTVVRQEWSKLGATDFSAHVTALQAPFVLEHVKPGLVERVQPGVVAQAVSDGPATGLL